MTFQKLSKDQLTIILLLFSILLGLTLRLINLDGKPPSTIELATLIFSLGNSVESVPLNQAIALDTLLQPLQVNPLANISDVFHHLMTESTHPPSYFILTHLWLKLFPSEGNLGSLFAARSLSVLFGILTIPAIFGLAYLSFNSLIIAQVSALLMAVSPYGIYLSQEARHYTFAILWILASLSCLIIAIRTIIKSKPIPISLRLTWILVNGFGIAAHYFFSLILVVEALILAIFWLKDLIKLRIKIIVNPTWLSIYGVGLGTLITALIWLPFVYTIPDDSITQWIQNKLDFNELFAPLARLLAWIITFIFMLPVEGVNLIISITSGVILLGFLTWVTPALIKGMRLQLNQSPKHLELKILALICLFSIGILLIFTYILHTDLTLAARYNFVYFPAFIILVASCLAVYWQNLIIPNNNSQLKLPNWLQPTGKKVVIAVLLMSFLGALTVISNFGYQKSRQPELLASYIQKMSTNPILIVSEYKTHSETRALIGLGLELKKLEPNLPQINFILAERKDNDPQTSTEKFYQVLNQLPRPLDVWTVDFSPTISLENNHCLQNTKQRPKIKGYRFRQYYCY
jgi:uncharacterized membrane protein